jgi:hypothetical protein
MVLELLISITALFREPKAREDHPTLNGSIISRYLKLLCLKLNRFSGCGSLLRFVYSWHCVYMRRIKVDFGEVRLMKAAHVQPHHLVIGMYPYALWSPITRRVSYCCSSAAQKQNTLPSIDMHLSWMHACSTYRGQLRALEVCSGRNRSLTSYTSVPVV